MTFVGHPVCLFVGCVSSVGHWVGLFVGSVTSVVHWVCLFVGCVTSVRHWVCQLSVGCVMLAIGFVCLLGG